MPVPPFESREPVIPISMGERAVAVLGDNQGTINTGVIIDIHGEDIQKNRDIARTILAATLLAPPLEPRRKKGDRQLCPGDRKDFDRSRGRAAARCGAARQVPRDAGPLAATTGRNRRVDRPGHVRRCGERHRGAIDRPGPDCADSGRQSGSAPCGGDPVQKRWADLYLRPASAPPWVPRPSLQSEARRQGPHWDH